MKTILLSSQPADGSSGADIAGQVLNAAAPFAAAAGAYGPAAIVAARGALALYEALLPLIRDAVRRGDIPAEDQVAVLTKFNQIRANSDALFSGAHWKLEGTEDDVQAGQPTQRTEQLSPEMRSTE